MDLNIRALRQNEELGQREGNHHLADGIWFNIYSFLQCIHYEDEESIQKKSSTLHKIFRLIGYISKNDNARIVRYIQQIPHELKCLRHDKDGLIWACRNGMKLRALDLGMSSSTEAILILKSCNVSHMHTLKICPAAFVQRTAWGTRIAAGDTSNIRQSPVLTSIEIQRKVVDNLLPSTSLEKLHLRVKKMNSILPS